MKESFKSNLSKISLLLALFNLGIVLGLVLEQFIPKYKYYTSWTISGVAILMSLFGLFIDFRDHKKMIKEIKKFKAKMVLKMKNKDDKQVDIPFTRMSNN